MKPARLAHFFQCALLGIIIITIYALTPINYSVSAFTPNSIVINEVAWGGNQTSSNDEWIELYNNSSESIDLTGWVLQTADNGMNITLSGTMAPGQYSLLERSDDTVVTDQSADFIFTNSLSNTNESLELYDGSGVLIDTANVDSGDWPAGTGSPDYYSMERVDPSQGDINTNWESNNGITINGIASDGSTPIMGTPKRPNSVDDAPNGASPTPTPTSEPHLVINEVAWMGTTTNTGHEWIELYNPTTSLIDLTDWQIKTADEGINQTLSGNIPADGYYLLEKSSDQVVSDTSADFIYTGTLTNNGDILELYDDSENLIDSANANGGDWPAGDNPTKASMERIDPLRPDNNQNWATNDGLTINGLASDGSSPIIGTPKAPNSVYDAPNGASPTPTPTPTEDITPTPSDAPNGASPTPTPTVEPTTTPTEEPTLTPTPTDEPTPTPFPGKAVTRFSLLQTTCSLQSNSFSLGGVNFNLPRLVCVKDSSHNFFHLSW